MSKPTKEQVENVLELYPESKEVLTLLFPSCLRPVTQVREFSIHNQVVNRVSYPRTFVVGDLVRIMDIHLFSSTPGNSEGLRRLNIEPNQLLGEPAEIIEVVAVPNFYMIFVGFYAPLDVRIQYRGEKFWINHNHLEYRELTGANLEFFITSQAEKSYINLKALSALYPQYFSPKTESELNPQCESAINLAAECSK